MSEDSRYAIETISNSGLGALEISPRAYRFYKDKGDKKSQSYFDLGSAVHCKVLEPNEFDDRYEILNVVTPSAMFGKFIEALLKTRTEACEVEGLERASWIANAYGEAGFKWTVDKVWEKFTTDPSLIGYYNIQVEAAKTGKVILSTDDQKAMDACINAIGMHSKASELLFGYALSDTYNEKKVIWRHPEFPEFMMNSIFDRLIIDHYSKTAILVDLKTTAKSITGFKTAYRQYKYYRQMALYRLAVRWFLENEGLKDWDIKIYIVATQTNGYGDTGVFVPSESDLLKGEQDASKLLTRMKWHFDNDKWDYPMEYYTNDGVFVLDLDEE